MKNRISILLILLPLLSYGQTWTIDAGDDFVFCDGDENVQLQGSVNTFNESVSVTWETEFTIGSNTYYADDFLDDIHVLNPTLLSNIHSVSELTFYINGEDTLGNEQMDSVTVSVSDFTVIFHDFYFYIEQGDSVQLQITAFGGLPPYTYEWLPNYNIVDNTVETPIAFPDYSTNYEVTIIDSRGCVVPSNYCDVNEVYVSPLNVTEIENSNLKWYFEGEQLRVETNQFINEEVLLYDVCGKLVHTYQITEDILQVNLSNLEKGAYFLKFKDETLKFVW